MSDNICTDFTDQIHCHVFDCNGSFYLYDHYCGIIIELSHELYICLRKFLQGDELSPFQKSIIDEMINSGLICGENEINKNCSDQYTTAYLSFAPIYQCNFRCSYCFGDHGDKYNGECKQFTDDSLKAMLEYFLYTVYPDVKQYRIDFVSGGEPLLGFDIIKKTIAYVENFSSQTGKKVSIWLCTNGSLLSDEISEFLSLHNVSIGISLDGKKEIHDQHRIDAKGEGTYDRVVKNIQQLKSDTKLSKKFKNIWGLSVGSNDNHNFVDILKHHKKIGFQSVQIKLVRNNQNFDICNILQSYDDLVTFIFDKFKNKEYDYINLILNDNDQFGKVLKRILLNQTVTRRCSAGTNKITICPDGTIYPCDSFVGIKEFELGTIDSGIHNKDTFSNAVVSKRGKCRKCSLRYLCGGDCYYNSYINTGSILSPDVEFCKIQKHIIEACIVLRYQMEKYDSKAYKILVKGLVIKNDYAKNFG